MGKSLQTQSKTKCVTLNSTFTHDKGLNLAQRLKLDKKKLHCVATSITQI